MTSSLTFRSRLMGLSTAISMVLLTQCMPAAHGQDSLPAKGEDTSKVLQQEKENKNRKAKNITDLQMVRQKEKALTEVLTNIESPDGDPWYSPHLRDIKQDIGARENIAKDRADAWQVQPCLPESTEPYRPLFQDENFKTCCVRQGEENNTYSKIACDHPAGDGWAGLVEIFYPTTMFNWGNQRTETVLMTKDEVDKELKAIDSMMEGEDAVAWVTKSNEILQKAIDKGGSGGGGNGSSDVQSTVKDVIKDVRPKDEKIKFSDGLEGEGLVVRPHLYTLEEDFKRQLARQYCLHPEQFTRIMTEQDPAQKVPQNGGGGGQLAERIPPFCNFCKNGVALMTDQEETTKLTNIDNTPTDFIKGMRVYNEKGPGYCQMMHNRDDSYLTVDQKKVVEKAFGMDAPSEEETGYTCRNDGKSWVGMVPVTLYRTAQAARRAPEHMLPFLIAAGLYTSEKGQDNQMTDGQQHGKSYYKRFEPMPYFQIQGKQWQPGQGKTNERGDSCPRAVKGESYEGEKVQDHAYLADKTPEGEKGLPFVQEVIKDWNWFYATWTKDGHTQYRGLNDQSQNYGAALRVMAMCPTGWVRWSQAPGYCGGEKFW